MENISGIIEGVNQKEKNYGIVINKVWYNGFGKCPCKKGDLVDVTWELSGQWRNIDQVFVKEASSVPTPSVKGITQVEVFEHLTLTELKQSLNEFNQKNHVIATQVFQNPDRGESTYDAITYFN